MSASDFCKSLLLNGKSLLLFFSMSALQLAQGSQSFRADSPPPAVSPSGQTVHPRQSVLPGRQSFPGSQSFGADSPPHESLSYGEILRCHRARQWLKRCCWRFEKWPPLIKHFILKGMKMHRILDEVPDYVTRLSVVFSCRPRDSLPLVGRLCLLSNST